MQQTRASRLVSNTAALAVGTLTAQFVNFLMLPFLTAHLSAAEYGSVDLTVTLVALIGPVASLAVSEAVLRFAMSEAYSRAAVIISGTAVATIGFVLALALLPLLSGRPSLAPLVPLMYALLAAQIVGELSGQYLKSQNLFRLVAASGIVYSLLVAGGNVIFVGALGWGARGNLSALVIAGLATYGTLLGLILNQTRPRRADFSVVLVRRMIAYSAPLMPNGVLWWLVNSASRIILMAMSGPAAVGVYAVATRVPTLLSLATTVFWQAWQISAIEQRDSPTRLDFQNKVLAAMTGTLFLATSGLLMILLPLMHVLVNPEFFLAWKVVPPLLGAALFLTLATFWGTEYRVQMTTVNALWSSSFGAASAIGLNFLLVPGLGPFGAAIGTMGGYAALWLSRLWDLRRVGWLPKGVWRIAVGLLFLAAQASVLYLDPHALPQVVIQALPAGAIIVLYGRSITSGVRVVLASRSRG